MRRSKGACSRLRCFFFFFTVLRVHYSRTFYCFTWKCALSVPLPVVILPASPVVSGACLHFSARVTLGCNRVLTTFWHACGPCYPLALNLFLCQFNGALFLCLEPWLSGRAAESPIGSRMATASRERMWKSGSKRCISPMTQYRNVDIAGMTPALGFGVPTNYPRKKCSLV